MRAGCFLAATVLLAGTPLDALRAQETAMSAPGFYADHETSKPVLDRHQSLMWEVGDLLSQWEMLQAEAEEKKAALAQ